MKKTVACLLLLGGFHAAFSQTKAKWVSQPVVVDGNAREWNMMSNYYDVDTKMMYGISNDSSHLYLCFFSRDEMNQMKLMRAGMQVIITTKGKTKRRASIAYPLPRANESMQVGGRKEHESTDGSGTTPGSRPRPDMQQRRSSFLLRSTNMELDGFATRNGSVPTKDSSGIAVCINWDSANTMIYELVIPYKELFGEHYTKEDLAKELTLKVEVNAVERPANSGGNGGGGNGGGGMGGGGMGGGGMGGGGMGGGGMGGGGMGGRGNGGMGGGGGQGNWGGGNGGGSDRNAMFESYSFKQKFILATSAVH